MTTPALVPSVFVPGTAARLSVVDVFATDGEAMVRADALEPLIVGLAATVFDTTLTELLPNAAAPQTLGSFPAGEYMAEWMGGSVAAPQTAGNTRGPWGLGHLIPPGGTVLSQQFLVGGYPLLPTLPIGFASWSAAEDWQATHRYGRPIVHPGGAFTVSYDGSAMLPGSGGLRVRLHRLNTAEGFGWWYVSGGRATIKPGTETADAPTLVGVQPNQETVLVRHMVLADGSEVEWSVRVHSWARGARPAPQTGRLLPAGTEVANDYPRAASALRDPGRFGTPRVYRIVQAAQPPLSGNT